MYIILFIYMYACMYVRECLYMYIYVSMTLLKFSELFLIFPDQLPLIFLFVSCRFLNGHGGFLLGSNRFMFR